MASLLTTALALISHSLKPSSFCIYLTDRVKGFKYAISCYKPWGRKEIMNVSELLYGNHSRQNQLLLRKSGDSTQVLSSIWNVVCFFPLCISSPILFRKFFSHTLESGPKNPTDLCLEIWICHDTVQYSYLCTSIYPRLKSNPSQITTSAFHTEFGCAKHHYQKNQTNWRYQQHCVSWTDTLKRETAGHTWGIVKSMWHGLGTLLGWITLKKGTK